MAYLKNGANDVVRTRSPRYFLSDHVETINRDDRWNYFSAIAAIATIVAISAIAAIIWKPGLSDISLGGRLREVLGRLSFPEV